MEFLRSFESKETVVEKKQDELVQHILDPVPILMGGMFEKHVRFSTCHDANMVAHVISDCKDV